MIRATRVASFMLAILVTLPVISAADPVMDQQILAAAKAIHVSKIESGLPDIRLDAWLRSLVGFGAPLSWVLNDCGEQAGVPEIDGTRDLPICGELEADLTAGRSVYLYFIVGTQSKGVVESRSLYLAAVLDGDQTLTFPSLSSLADYLRTERE